MAKGAHNSRERCFGLHTKGTGRHAKASLSEEQLTYYFKVTPCNRNYPHDWASCLCAHKGERAARRDLRTHDYLPIACQHAKQRRECPQGDGCRHSHNLFEYWLHPKRFRTEMCLFGTHCDRPMCFFAHSEEELRPLLDGLPPAELCWSAGAAITSKHRSMAGPGAKHPQQDKHRQQQVQQHAMQQQQQHQAHAYMQLPGEAVVSSGQGSCVLMSSQPLLLVHQQPQQQIMLLASATWDQPLDPISLGNSLPVAAGAAPQITSCAGLAGTPLVGNLAGGDVLAVAEPLYAWQHQQQLQQVHLGDAGLHYDAGSYLMPAAEGWTNSQGAGGLGPGGQQSAVMAGQMAAVLPLAAATAGSLPAVATGQLLSQQCIILPGSVLPTAGCSCCTYACGNELTGLAAAARTNSCSSASSSSSVLNLLATGQANFGLQGQLPVPQAAVHVAAAGLDGLQLNGSSQLNLSDDLSQIMQQLQSMQQLNQMQQLQAMQASVTLA